VYVFKCATEGCEAVLESAKPRPSCHNPRKRWILNAEIKLDEEDREEFGGAESIRINLCPDCASHYLNLDEDFYKSLEHTESMIDGNRPVHLSKALEN
jgi:hypothetical protein